MRWAPSSSFRITPFWVLIVNSESISAELISIKAWRWNISLDIHYSLITVLKSSFKCKCLGILANRGQWIISSWAWGCVIRPQITIKDLLRESFSPCAEAIGRISLNVHSKGRGCVIWFEYAWYIISIRTWVLVMLELEFLFTEPLTNPEASSSRPLCGWKSVTNNLVILGSNRRESLILTLSKRILQFAWRGAYQIVGSQLSLAAWTAITWLCKFWVLNCWHCFTFIWY